jgi:hypothetical protein
MSCLISLSKMCASMLDTLRAFLQATGFVGQQPGSISFRRQVTEC